MPFMSGVQLYWAKTHSCSFFTSGFGLVDGTSPLTLFNICRFDLLDIDLSYFVSSSSNILVYSSDSKSMVWSSKMFRRQNCFPPLRTCNLTLKHSRCVVSLLPPIPSFSRPWPVSIAISISIKKKWKKNESYISA